MKIKSFLCMGLAVSTISTCTSKKQVSKEDTIYESTKREVRVDTVYKERVVEKEVKVVDTVFRQSTQLNIVGKPTWDSVTKTWKPFIFDYMVYGSKGDSTRYKGSFSGEGSANYGTDWETMYRNLLESQKEKRIEASKTKEKKENEVKFEQSKKEVLKEGYGLEMTIYIICGTAFVFYCIGLATPKLSKALIKFIKSKIPITWFTKQK